MPKKEPQIPLVVLEGNEPGYDNRPKEDMDYHYNYPHGLNFHPKSDLHKHIVKLVLRRAQQSRSVIQKRFNSWEEIDKQLMVYVDVEEQEKKRKKLATDAPVAVVVPTLFATMDTLLTYLMTAFMDDPIFRYEGVEPDDVIGSVLLEQLINFQTRRNKIGLALHTQWRDCLAYGIGPVHMGWEVEKGYIPTKVNNYYAGIPIGKKASTKEGIVFEGNQVYPIDPWNYLPDPSVGIHDVQKGEFVGWVDQTGRLEILEDEANNGLYFNGRYLKHMRPVAGAQASGETLGYVDYKQPQRDLEGTKTDAYFQTTIRPVQRVHMYQKLIPAEWGLGNSEKTEKWYFCVADRQLLIAAKPTGLRHNRFPVAVSAPHYDGRTIAPVSMLEQIYGMADFINWLFNSHSLNVRKAINDTLIVDPQGVELDTVLNPGPGKLIYMKPKAWGKTPKDVIHQLNVSDVTKQHIPDIASILQMMEGVTATDQSLKGQMRSSPDRVTAEESRGVRKSGLGRSGKTARLISMQSMADLAYFFAAHTQQFMSQDTFVRISGGRWEEALRKESGAYGKLGKMESRHKVSPLDISINWDVYPHDATVTTGENAQSMVQFIQLLGMYPELVQVFDIPRMYMKVAREAGFTNVSQYIRNNPPIEMNVQNPETVEKEKDKGNIVPWLAQTGAA